MGYVNDTKMSQWIPASAMSKSAGTWTPTLASNTIGDVRTDSDASFSVYIPIIVPGNSDAYKGAKLLSIDVYYKILTTAADDFATVELEKMALPVAAAAPGTAVTGAAVTITQDALHDTAAERKAVGTHCMTVTLTTPEWVDNNVCYWLQLIVDAASGTIFTLWGAVANYELRV